MMRLQQTTQSGLRVPIACCVLALVAMSLGHRGDNLVRSLIRDFSVPGLLAGNHLRHWRSQLDMTCWPWTRARLPDMDSERAEKQDVTSEMELRQLRHELAQERQKLASFQSSLGPIHWPQQSAHGVERVPARVLLAENSYSHAGGLILSAGTAAGVESDRIAVESVITTARDTTLPSRAIVLAGATVVGRTDQVGTWSSTIVPVADPRFRAHVRLVRQAAAGTAMGEQGVLEGDGNNGCLVKYVPSTAAVEVGNYVYSFDPTGRIPQPLYYGEIDQAELRPEAPHWDIHVRPAVDLAQLSEVQILIEGSLPSELAADR